MTTQDILFLIAAFKKGADFCRGDIDYWLSKDELNEIFHTLCCEANCIDFLSHGEKVMPVAVELRKALREFLDSAADATGEDCQLQWRLKESAIGRFKKWFDPHPKVIRLFGNNPGVIYPSTAIACGCVSFCETWINWIDAYFPIDPNGQQQQEKNNEEPIKQDDDFRNCFLVQDDKKDELLNKLHLLIDGKKGKPVALVIRLCVELGLMSKPTFGVLKAEFGNIGNASGFNHYYRNYETSYTKEEKDGLKRHFEPFLDYI